MLKYFMELLLEEIRVSFLKLKRYPLNTITLSITLYVIFLGLFFGLQRFQVNFADGSVTGLVIGYLFWSYTMFALNDPAETVSGEISTGMLEHVYSTPFPPIILVYIRSIASFINATIVSIIIFILALITVRVRIDFLSMGRAFIVLIIMCIGIYGLGIILAGLTLKYVRIGQIGQIINFLLLFLAGIIFPIDKLPSLVQQITDFIPLTGAIEIIGQVVENNSSSLFVNKALLPFIILNLSYLVVGSLFFNYMYRKVRRGGNLGKY